LIIKLNGTALQVAEGARLSKVLETMKLPSTKGVAVAVDGAVVPRSEWEQLVMTEGAVVEVLRAVQGG
jgi:sulfur carrier protein